MRFLRGQLHVDFESIPPSIGRQAKLVSCWLFTVRTVSSQKNNIHKRVVDCSRLQSSPGSNGMFTNSRLSKSVRLALAFGAASTMALTGAAMRTRK